MFDVIVTVDIIFWYSVDDVIVGLNDAGDRSIDDIVTAVRQ